MHVPIYYNHILNVLFNIKNVYVRVCGNESYGFLFQEQKIGIDQYSKLKWLCLVGVRVMVSDGDCRAFNYNM